MWQAAPNCVVKVTSTGYDRNYDGYRKHCKLKSKITFLPESSVLYKTQYRAWLASSAEEREVGSQLQRPRLLVPAFSGMACGATLQRPMQFEAALLSPGSPKRRRCAPLSGPTPGLRPPDAEPPPLLQTQTPRPTLQQPAPPAPSNSGANFSEYKTRI
ncbi:unnamed protein product [Rangifer tarandus platyrhynchus]|uniref:Uncharacterized protein n=2 Tax=Rangifer tarandus platyrhynchus TaxID=3082113 RepID=A0ACB0E6U3_RANTA|nr:unnamed protein product [Rangifer tarandus platyrhynchus]CAI9696353.1 unnamed protein product [Rangifer tarandus platyrhynchus]